MAVGVLLGAVWPGIKDLFSALSIGTFTIASQEALATVIGLVYVALWIKQVWFKATAAKSPD